MANSSALNPFEPAGEAQWRAAVDKALKGADFDRAMFSRTADGIVIAPLRPRKTGATPILKARAGQRWRIAARVEHPEEEDAARQALADLEGGADMLSLIFHHAPSARGFGLKTTDARTLDAALEGVSLDLVAIRLEPAPQARITARIFAEVAARRKLDPAALDVSFNIDPIGLLAHSGVLLAPWADVGQRLADIVSEFGKLGFKGPFLGCDARMVHEAGGSEGQELGWALACATAYMRALTDRGVALAEAERMVGFTLAVDQDQFIGIAKLRALRRLMARVQAACGLAPAPIRIHAETAWRMMTKADTPVNMLRNATAVFAAAVGGADSIGALPHTAALGPGDDFARRVARNTQHVLAEESHLWRVADPAAGAGSIEALTDALCERGWAAFQQIESEGGLVASLTDGRLQQAIAAVRARRERDIATGKAALTGTSAFPDLTEKARTALDLKPAVSAAPKGGSVCASALPSLRLAEPFEQCRDRAAALVTEGKAATVFLAMLGPAQAAAPRIGFAGGVFAAGGIGAIQPDSFAGADGATDLVALTDAFKASGARLACLCGPDGAYDAEAVDAAMALAASGAHGIWLAGRPGEREAALRAAGMTGFIFAGCDMIAALKEALDVIAA